MKVTFGKVTFLMQKSEMRLKTSTQDSPEPIKVSIQNVA